MKDAALVKVFDPPSAPYLYDDIAYCKEIVALRGNNYTTSPNTILEDVIEAIWNRCSGLTA